MWTAQITDLNLATPDGTDVVYFDTKTVAKAAWEAGYYNTLYCSHYWGGDLPAMSDEFTVTLWKGKLEDVTDIYPDAQITLGHQRRGVWRKVY